MIDIITIAGIQGFRHYHPRRGCKTDEDKFYAEFGNSRLIRFGGWLASLDLGLGRRGKAEAQSPSSCNCGAHAAFLLPR
ncbi:hypothetical protein NE852_04190 [Rhizobium sp. Pop5]|uniref:hypothetical protein n=1 Tax=Rhizobium sp. Pop5 TaxID=1223565 RepID=UPI000FFCB638|nr:hypothetical protein [Rhizobium sp. Pop5]UVD57415.1 hypothetical protein NE852_04190 [Rhizobium sp. Pop5]